MMKHTNDSHVKCLRIDHDIIGFEIAVTKSIGVHVRERANELSEDFGCNGRRHRGAIDLEELSEGHCRLLDILQELIVVARRLLMVNHPKDGVRNFVHNSGWRVCKKYLMILG